MRPKLKIELAPIDKALEFIGWLVVIGTWILVFMRYSDLPETIPTHYNIAGEADRLGQKSSIFMMPIFGTILFIGLTFANKFPHIFNYPTTITDDNALAYYSNATRMVRVLKLIIVLVFGLILLRTLQMVNSNTDELGTWLLPLTIGLFLVPALYFWRKSKRLLKSNR